MLRKRALGVMFAGYALLVLAAPASLQAQESPDALRQLVAPIALYPDQLLAEILTASTYPDQVDEAARWLQRNASLAPDQIANGVDRFDWDPSVKALTEFPMVLANMAQNLAWTSALGDAYFNQPDDVMDAVQDLRERATASGELRSNSQIAVRHQGGIIVIAPFDVSTVYVPSYDCWAVYGAPIRPWPGFFYVRGLTAGPRLVWSLSFNIGGAFGRANWGWNHWAFDWGNRRVAYQRNVYVSRSRTVIDRHYAPRDQQQSWPGPVGPRQGPTPRGPVATPRTAPQGQRGGPPVPTLPPGQRGRGRGGAPDPKDYRGFPSPNPTTPASGTRSGAIGDINHGGVVSDHSARGQSSMGVPPAAPKQKAPPPPPPDTKQKSPPPPPPPPAGRGRGRGGV